MTDKLYYPKPVGGRHYFIDFQRRGVRFTSVTFERFLRKFEAEMDKIREEFKDERYSSAKILALIAPEGDLFTPNEDGKRDRRRVFLEINGSLFFDSHTRELSYRDMKHCGGMGYSTWVKKGIQRYKNFEPKNPKVDVVLRVCAHRDRITRVVDEKDLLKELEKKHGKGNVRIIRDEENET